MILDDINMVSEYIWNIWTLHKDILPTPTPNSKYGPGTPPQFPFSTFRIA